MLVTEEREVPQAAEGEVLVEVAAAGVNRPDVMQRQGLYPPPKGATDIPGLEIAGAVAVLGAGIKRWKIGDQVMALVIGGGYAQYCPAHESHCLPIPAGLSMVQAAAMMSHEPIALQLRFLQTMREISSEHNTTTFLPVPIDLFTPLIKKSEPPK